MRVPPIAPDFDSGSSTQNELLAWMETNLSDHGTIFQSHAYGASVYVITDPQHVEHVLRKNWLNYRRGRAIKRIRMLLGKGLVVSEGELWKRQRRMIQPVFHEKAIERLTSMIQERNQVLLARWTEAAHKKQGVNVTRDISVATLDIILKVIFGNDYDKVIGPFSMLSEEPERTMQFAQEFRALGHHVRNIVALRGPTDDSLDLLGVMLRARDRDTGEAMSISQIVDEVLTAIVAGHETAATTLNLAWHLLSQHPHVAEKLYAEVSTVGDLRQQTYTRWIIEETMRLYPALWLYTRQAMQDDTLGDYFVPAKTEIYICPYVIQRRVDLWPEPNRFHPERFGQPADRHPLSLLAFAAGPRNCIGEHLARLEMQIHLATIGGKLRLHYPDTTPLELELGVNLRSKHDLIMLPTLIG